jgi:(2Fe-2S) ferredoxin
VEERPGGPYRRILFVCGTERPPGEEACGNRGAAEIQKRLKEYVKSKGLQDRCRVARSSCLGLCEAGPNLCVMPENVWYCGVTPADVDEIRAKWIDPLQ